MWAPFVCARARVRTRAFGLRLHTAGRCSTRRWIVPTIESQPRHPHFSLFLPTSGLMKTPAKSLLRTARSLQPLCVADVKGNNCRHLDKEHIDTEYERKEKKVSYTRKGLSTWTRVFLYFL